LNGVRTGLPNTIFNTSQNFTVSTWDSRYTTSNVYGGAMDELKIYNSTLTPQDVLVDYNQSSAALVGNYSTESTTSDSGQATTQPSNSQGAKYCDPGSTNYCAKPVGEWVFEEKSGSVVKDVTGNGNDATLINSPKWVQGKVGTGLEFDGTSSYASAGD